jgi:ribose 5-phosphate isomerase RpiB
MNNYIKIFHIFISLFDYFTSKRICNFLKKRLKNQKIVLFDVGAHKGETINLFSKNFSIDKIYSFEANKEVYKILKKKDDHNIFTFNFGVGEEETTKDFNTV